VIRRVLQASCAAAAIGALFIIVRHQMTAGLPLCVAASLLLTACLLIETEMASAAFVLLLACASAQTWALWLAESRGAFAGLVAGGFLWAVKRQNPRRRWVMLAGVVVFAFGLAWQAHRTGQAPHWPRNEYRRLLSAAGPVGLGLFAEMPALFLVWFLGPSSGDDPLSEGPALAALAIFAGAVFSSGSPFGPPTLLALVLMAASFAISRRPKTR